MVTAWLVAVRKRPARHKRSARHFKRADQIFAAPCKSGIGQATQLRNRQVLSKLPAVTPSPPHRVQPKSVPNRAIHFAAGHHALNCHFQDDFQAWTLRPCRLARLNVGAILIDNGDVHWCRNGGANAVHRLDAELAVCQMTRKTQRTHSRVANIIRGRQKKSPHTKRIGLSEPVSGRRSILRFIPDSGVQTSAA